MLTAPPSTGFLAAGAQAGLIGGFLVASVAWPYAARAAARRHCGPRAGLVPSLWVAAVCVLLLVGGMEARAPAAPTVAILLLGQVVVPADGVGWSAMALYRSLHHA